jgi:D-sedoheptulose 7-phosphate isomerase
MVIKPTLWGGVAVGPAPVAEAKENEPVMLDTMIDAHIQCLERLRPMAPVLKQTGDLFLQCLLDGGKILICGNGGSASDAQHFAAEIVGRFERERRAYPAVALSTDTSILTAVGNDYGYDEVFARQVDGLGRPGDVLMGISTSGNSQNVIRAVKRAGSLGMKTVGLLGKDGGSLKGLVDRAIVIDSTVTARIQETHIFILHYWAWQIESGLPQTPGGPV